MHKNKFSLYHCRVCGLHQNGYLPWGKDGKTPSFNICPCCGTEWGYEDSSLASLINQRKKWLEHGATWFDSKAKPKNWALSMQLKNIPKEYK